MRYKALVLVFSLVLVAAACNRAAAPAVQQPESSENSATSQTPPAEQPKITEVQITSQGFAPNSVTVKKGDAVKFVNSDSVLRWPASDPHPIHTEYPEFDSKPGIAPSASWTFTFQEVGSWGFHDHRNPSHKGMVIVKE